MSGYGNRNVSGAVLTSAELLWVQTGNAGVVLLEEQASTPDATSGVTKFYAKDSDSKPYFLTGADKEYGPINPITISASEPGSPEESDLWIDVS